MRISASHSALVSWECHRRVILRHSSFACSGWALPNSPAPRHRAVGRKDREQHQVRGVGGAAGGHVRSGGLVGVVRRTRPGLQRPREQLAQVPLEDLAPVLREVARQAVGQEVHRGCAARQRGEGQQGVQEAVVGGGRAAARLGEGQLLRHVRQLPGHEAGHQVFAEGGVQELVRPEAFVVAQRLGGVNEEEPADHAFRLRQPAAETGSSALLW
ncbi:hypothetical protein GCM10020001_014600 [Nonomuraea salmonea]